MQAKISSFFKPTAVGAELEKQQELELELSALADVDVSVTYSRRPPPDDKSPDLGAANPSTSLPPAHESGRVVNRKRNYAQFHLELGQSDFLLHTCTLCGMAYARGEDSDEKFHRLHHRAYNQGIRFKGWHDERQIPMHWTDGHRVVLVLDEDPPSHKRKVQQVLQLMERDLGLSKESLWHKPCKVFLYIRKSRIVACLVAEQIKMAHRVIPRGGGDVNLTPSDTNSITSKTIRPIPSTLLHFGDATFYRERSSNCSSKARVESPCADGALICSEEIVEAACGVRAVWVVPSLRRHRIATQLLDAVRSSFLTDNKLEISQCAFSHPTAAGRAFAAHYTGTQAFLVYK